MIKKRAETISAEELRDSYVDNVGAGILDAAKGLGCSYNEFRRALALNGFEPKPKTRNWQRKSTIPELSNREWLAKELEIKSMRQIAKDLQTSVGNVADRVYRYGIKGKTFNKSFAIKTALKKKYPNGRRGRLASNWKGGRIKRGPNCRYIMIHKPDHPYATKQGYVMEHRVVMEKQLGRLLKSSECVHHINGDTFDNRIENLKLMTRSEHVQLHFDAIKEVERLKKILDEHGIKY